MEQLEYLEEKTNEELLEAYQKSRDIKIKQELTLRYLYIVKAIALQMQNVYQSAMQMEDIINEGAIAIMKGIDRYDPEKDNKFETFISKRIRGMIIDLVRKNDWMPRDFRKQNKAIEDARTQLSLSLGRPPLDEEIAKYLRMDIKKCRKIQRMSTMVNVLSLDKVMSNEEDEQQQTLQIPCNDIDSQPERAFLKEEAKQILIDGVNDLKEKEKLVISLYYVEELNMGQIAQVMQVSEPRISQIHSAAIRKLKDYMNSHL